MSVTQMARQHYEALVEVNYGPLMTIAETAPAPVYARRWCVDDMKKGFFVELKGVQGWWLVYDRQHRSRRNGGELFTLQRFVRINGVLHPTNLWNTAASIKDTWDGAPRPVVWADSVRMDQPLFFDPTTKKIADASQLLDTPSAAEQFYNPAAKRYRTPAELVWEDATVHLTSHLKSESRGASSKSRLSALAARSLSSSSASSDAEADDDDDDDDECEPRPRSSPRPSAAALELIPSSPSGHRGGESPYDAFQRFKGVGDVLSLSIRDALESLMAAGSASVSDEDRQIFRSISMALRYFARLCRSEADVPESVDEWINKLIHHGPPAVTRCFTLLKKQLGWPQPKFLLLLQVTDRLIDRAFCSALAPTEATLSQCEACAMMMEAIANGAWS
eukprot:m51a1_g4800 hypothetical protein (391) ;mRNA; f:108749-110926